MIPTINFCPVCRGPVNGNREKDIDRLAARLRDGHTSRIGGEAGLVTLVAWSDVDEVERDHWRDQALTVIAALDVP